MNHHKVLHLIDSSGMYGAEKVVIALLEELQQSEFPSILGCICESRNNFPQVGRTAELLMIPVEYFPMKRGVSLSGLRRIIKFVRQNDISIIHSHGYKPTILLSLVPRKHFKVVSTVHGWSKTSAGLKGRAYEYLDSLALRRVDKVIAVSQAVQVDLARKGIAGGKTLLIYNGILQRQGQAKVDVVSIRQKLGLSVDAFVIGSVGRLSAVKGHGYLISAMPYILKCAKNVQLIIAGDGPSREEYELLIRALGLESCVHLCGYIEDIHEFLSALDLFVLPSLSEGLPIALLEAMDLGKPVLATSVGGIPEVITNLCDGILVEPANSEAIANAVIQLHQDPTLLKELGENSRELVAAKFTSFRMSEQYSDMYAELQSQLMKATKL